MQECHYSKDDNQNLDKTSSMTVGQVAHFYQITIEKAKELVKGKPSSPNPDAPEDPEMILYDMFGGKEKIHTVSSGSSTEIRISTEVGEEQAPLARAMVDSMFGASSNEQQVVGSMMDRGGKGDPANGRGGSRTNRTGRGGKGSRVPKERATAGKEPEMPAVDANAEACQKWVKELKSKNTKMINQ